VALEASDMNDSTILGATKQSVNEDGRKQLSVALPSGRLLTSEWMRPENASGTVLVKWCDLVREQAVADAHETRLRAERDSAMTPAAETAPVIAAESAEQDALRYTQSQALAAAAEVQRLDDCYLAIGRQLIVARKAAKRWNAIYESLNEERDDV
jgi:hypothetical protein